MKKKRIINIFLSIILIQSFLILFSINNVTAANILGDVNGDNKVGSGDYVLVRKYLSESYKLDSNQKKAADMNKDNKINSIDFNMIKKKSIENSEQLPITAPNNNNIEVYFLNTIDYRKDLKVEYGNSNSFIIKTSSNKYILFDTGKGKTPDGKSSKEIEKLIYNRLKELQKKDTVDIDYLVLSHMHTDHIGNAISLLNDKNVVIKNLILKGEMQATADEKIVKVAKNNNVNIIDTTSLSEGYNYKIDSKVQMYLFNVKDVYSKSDDCQKDYYIKFVSKYSKYHEYAKTPDGKYIYFDGSDYIKNDSAVKIYTSDNLDFNGNDTYKIKNRYYAIVNTKEKISSCNANTNSVALVFQVNTSKGNKYVYLPGDLQNNGYSPFGEYDSKYETTIHGHLSAYYWQYKMVNNKPAFIVKNNKLVKSTRTSAVKKASEYITAVNIRKKISNIVNNIVIYQASHHGINNTKESINKLKINKKGVFVIIPAQNNISTSTAFSNAESAYVLRNTKLMNISGEKKKGIKCVIKESSATTCIDY